MKLTKAQRHNYYKEALQKDLCYNGVCQVLCDLLLRDFGGFFRIEICPKYFPEFGRRKPVRITDDNGYWWPINNKSVRVKALKKCIRETAPKKYSRQSKKVK